MKLQLNGIQKSYGSKQVLKDCTFTFEKGKIYGLLGRNGAGKTTLFNCLTDEVTPDGGSALILDEGGGRPWPRNRWGTCSPPRCCRIF